MWNAECQDRGRTPRLRFDADLSIPHSAFRIPHWIHSTVTDFARFRGWSTLHPRRTAM